LKNILALLIIIYFGNIYSQENNFNKKDSITYTIQTCDQGTIQAKEDFNKEVYNCFSYGLVYQIHPDFSNFYQSYMKSNYNIVFKNMGCVSSNYSECYSQVMKELIFEKFGGDIFEKSRKEARKLYDDKNNK